MGDNLFTDVFPTDTGAVINDKYTSKIKSPVYTPSDRCPTLLELVDMSKANRLISEIQKSTVQDEEKEFLIEAARRHSVFHYENIADYYVHASHEMQHLMEKSALVIIDFDKAIQYGYTSLSLEVAQQYLNTYRDEK